MDSEMKFYQDESYYKPKFNQTLTKKEALEITDSLYLHCKDNSELLEEIDSLKQYIKNREI